MTATNAPAPGPRPTPASRICQVAAAKGLLPITRDRTWGYRILEGAPEPRTGYERALLESVQHRVAHFIAGVLPPLQKGLRRRRVPGRRDRTIQYPSD
ncbi:hypothetical protein [Streptomyces sp. NPDC101455]|uniref:hypothetical protein n=1 Tax=Streptomyces sp. NPDC101455 TaxID=3366142 RepID=UPI00381EEBB0